MHSEVPCPLCGGTERREIYPATKRPGPVCVSELACSTALLARYDRIVRCIGCGLHYTSPRAADSEILAAYSRVADRDFVEEHAARERTYRRLLSMIGKLAGGSRGRLLDVGCSTGLFLRQAREAGWEVEGLEPSGWAAGFARAQYGLEVQEKPIQQAELGRESFDVITAWDVIEHLPSPVPDIRLLSRALRPGGLFCASTHSIGSLAARLLGPRYPFLMAMHVTHFTSRTLARLLAEAGLRVCRTEPHIRFLRAAYLGKKLLPHAPRTARALLGAARMSGLGNTLIPVAGLGIFNAYARKLRLD